MDLLLPFFFFFCHCCLASNTWEAVTSLMMEWIPQEPRAVTSPVFNGQGAWCGLRAGPMPALSQPAALSWCPLCGFLGTPSSLICPVLYSARAGACLTGDMGSTL